MAQSFAQSHDAYNRGDHGGAKECSNAGKAHQRKMEQLNKEASDWIFRGQSGLLLVSRHTGTIPEHIT